MKLNDFKSEYAPSNIWCIAIDGEGCVCGPSPSIKQILENGKGKELQEIILGLIDTLAEFTSARYKFTPFQRQQLCNIIITLHPHLKIRQLHHFFALAMGGTYGKFYDKLEPMDIMAALSIYTKETTPAIWAKYYDKQHRF